ncbi:alpha/beta hydrolase [Specibacter sp. NPDC078709]
MIQGSAQRWFAEGFLDREPELSSRLLNTLRDTDQFSYAHCCGALAGFDVRNELGQIRVPLLAVAGSEDSVASPELMQEMVDAVNAGAVQRADKDTASADSVAKLATLPHVAHLTPAEAPAEVARLLLGLIHQTQP